MTRFIAKLKYKQDGKKRIRVTSNVSGNYCDYSVIKRDSKIIDLGNFS